MHLQRREVSQHIPDREEAAQTGCRDHIPLLHGYSRQHESQKAQVYQGEHQWLILPRESYRYPRF